jgi:replicative DNA helicase
MNEPRKNQKSIDQINAQYGKLPPQAIEVEQAVLGALMLEADAIHRVSDVIDTPSFYKMEHQKIFEVIKYVSTQQKPVDLLTVTMELKNRNILDEVGGPLEITQLTSRVASAAHIEFHARIIAQKFIQRELIRISSEIQVDSFDDTSDIDDLLNNARTKLNDVDNLILCSNSGQTSQVVAGEALKELEKDCVATRAGISPGVSTGLYHLDGVTGGWRNTNLIILAARPSVGKSSLALHFAYTAAMNGVWVNFYGLEMKNHDYFRILLSSLTDIPRSDIRDGNLTDEQWKKINEATGILEKLPIIWNDNPSVTVNHVRSNTIRNKRAGRCGLVIIDYLQLLKPSDKKAIREQQIADMSRTLKETAMSEDIPVIALSQLNRDVEKRSDKEPGLSDLRESGAIEQDADAVLFLWDPEEPKLKIGKNRRGKIGRINFWANKEKTVFGDSEPDTFEFNPNAGLSPEKEEPKQNDLPF